MDYAKHREKRLYAVQQRRAQEVHKQEKGSLISLFEPQAESVKVVSPRGERSSFVKLFEGLLLFALISIMSLFLIKETAEFYVLSEGNPTWAYLKAIIGEGLVMILAFVQCEDRISRLIQKLMIAALCIYSVWALSERILCNASGLNVQAMTVQQNIHSLEEQIARKDQFSKYYLSTGRVKSLKENEVELDRLHKELVAVRENSLMTKPADVIKRSSEALIMFRILVLFGNMFLIRILGSRFQGKDDLLTKD